MNRSATVRPFGIRDKVGYLFGDFGNDFTFIFSTMMLMKFYTDVMGVSAGVVGLVMTIARIVDAFTDVTMGRICDRSRTTAHGKFKPWLLRMCGPVAIASFLIYQSGLAGLPMWAKIAYLFVTYILCGSVFYTAINIPYGSMASAVSEEPDDRQSLSTFRTMGGTLAGVVIGVGLPLIAYEKVDGVETLIGTRVTIAAGVFSVLAVIFYLLCYNLVTERVHIETPQRKQESVLQMLKSAVHNRALISIIAASIAMLLAAALVKPLAKRFGKCEVSVVFSLFAVVINLLLFVIRPQNVWVYVGFQFLCWLGLGMFSMVSWALITDVIDYSELKSGRREDGTVYALYSFARKLGQAASAGLTGLLLELIGYSAATRTDPVVQEGLFNISVLVPALGFALLAAILWFWYPLHKKQVDANVLALKKKHASEA
ncbi:MFS transporter [Subdoligranulum variabile]|uniref:MFS transporter n=1 Tax=Subdoligranulum variabile TaxID=214851 RepID=UPI0026ECB719|nr:MFS transporter [Subdoligranulum variabile]